MGGGGGTLGGDLHTTAGTITGADTGGIMAAVTGGNITDVAADTGGIITDPDAINVRKSTSCTGGE